MSNDCSQRATCQRLGQIFVETANDAKVGISANAMAGKAPIHALRHVQTETTCGWYIWADEELSDADDFFQPLHASHLTECCKTILPYLGLPLGTRLIVDDQYENVWFDPTILEQ